MGLTESNLENLVYPQIKNNTVPRKIQTDDLTTRSDTPEIKSRRNDNYNNSNFNLLVNETKMSELETKLLALEQQNQFLIEKVKNNEKNFEIQLNRIVINNEGEKESRMKIEKYINILNNQVNFHVIRTL